CSPLKTAIMIVRDRPASSRTEVATMPPTAFRFSRLAGSISKPINDTSASIRRSDNAAPINPSPMIPAGIFGCMIRSPPSISLLFGFDAGGFGIRGPSRDFAADEGAEFVGAHRRNDHADACELLPCRWHCQEFLALGIELVDDRFRRARRRQQSIPDRGFEPGHGLGKRRKIRRQFVALRR